MLAKTCLMSDQWRVSKRDFGSSCWDNILSRTYDYIYNTIQGIYYVYIYIYIYYAHKFKDLEHTLDPQGCTMIIQQRALSFVQKDVEPQVLVQLTALLQFLCYVELSNACVTCAKYWWCG